jgi:hypothetical protein
MTSKLDVRMRRVYDDPSPADGTRVLTTTRNIDHSQAAALIEHLHSAR